MQSGIMDGPKTSGTLESAEIVMGEEECREAIIN